LHPLPRLSAHLGGPEIWIKRDDQTGLALGGNKTRKLEYLVGEALDAGAETLVTGGAAQSNHCRQTAAAAAASGLACHLALGGMRPERADGNLLIDELVGARLHWFGQQRRGEPLAALARRVEAEGARPYTIPYGGSSEVGVLGFVEAVRELGAQLIEWERPFNRLVFASSSAGTHAGLTLGRAHYGHRFAVTGIQIDEPGPDAPTLAYTVAELAQRTAARLGLPPSFDEAAIDLDSGYLGGGYGVVGAAEREAIRLVARTEGILLDPVYTGRAMAGLIDRVRRGDWAGDERVLFWHTGGAPALWAYGADLDTAAPG
jgi:D-cysteine desulfhydrase